MSPLEEPKLVHPYRFVPPVGVATLESASRRATWTPGCSVRLADGFGWRLSRIDRALLLFRPDLRSTLSRVFDSASRIARPELEIHALTIANAVFHAKLAQLAVELLQHNYELPDVDWRRLMSFKVIAEMLDLTVATSEAVADSASVWLPFHQPLGSDGRANPRLN